jgi:hypothetical protein
MLDHTAPLSSQFPIERIRVGAVECVLATFTHPAVPSHDNWGMSAGQPYLLEVVKPTTEFVLNALR